MNKQEAIEKIKNDNSLQGGLVEKSRAIYCIEQIQEPKKVVVPNFVAERLEKNKRHYKKWDEEARADFVIRYISDLFRFGEGLNPLYFTIDEKFSEWTTKNAYKFITAILFGYEVDKEKLYTVEIPNPNSAGGKLVLFKHQSTGRLILEMLNPIINKPKYLHLTESEIKQDFDFLWKFAVPVEDN
jgi:hypothetical protein